MKKQLPLPALLLLLLLTACNHADAINTRSPFGRHPDVRAAPHRGTSGGLAALRLLPAQSLLVTRVLSLAPIRYSVRATLHLRPSRPLAREQRRNLPGKLQQRSRPLRPFAVQRHLPRRRPAPARVEDPRHLLRPLSRRLLPTRPHCLPLRPDPAHLHHARQTDLPATVEDPWSLHRSQSLDYFLQPRDELWQQLPHRRRSLPRQTGSPDRLRQPPLLPGQQRPHPVATVVCNSSAASIYRFYCPVPLNCTPAVVTTALLITFRVALRTPVL